jgi:hypothetical protein
MSDPFAELEAARTRMRAQLAEARARNAALHAIAAQVRTTEATVRSPRGELEVTAGADGGIRSVRFAESALDLAPAELGRLTTETAAAAQRAAAELVPPLPGLGATGP